MDLSRWPYDGGLVGSELRVLIGGVYWALNEQGNRGESGCLVSC